MSDNQQLEINSEELYPEISVKECLIEGWDMFKKHWLILIGASFLVTYLMIIPMKIHTSLSILSLFFFPPLMAGDIYLSLKAGRDDNPSLKDLLKGFERYWLTVGYSCVIGLVLVFYMIPFTFFIDAISFAKIESSQNPMLFLISTKDGLIFTGAILLFIIFALKYFLSYYLLVDEPKRKVRELFRESKFLTHKYTLKLASLIIISLSFTIIQQLIVFLIPIKIVSDLLDIQSMFESSSVFLTSIFFILLGTSSSVYITLVYVRFYLKLKEIKQKPPFTITHDPM